MNQEILELGRNLEALKHQPGWATIIKVLRNWEDSAVSDILGYQGSDLGVLRYKQLAARSAKEIRVGLEKFIDEAINDARNELISQREEE